MRFILKPSNIFLIGTLLAPNEAATQQWLKSEVSRAKASEVVGNSTITILYSQPTVNWRTTWGKRVPFNKNWTIGKNEKTTIKFEEDVEVNNIRLGAGTYGFYVYPVNHDDWQLVFSKDTTGSAKRYDKVDDVVRVSVRPEVVSSQKQLRMGIENIKEESKDVCLGGDCDNYTEKKIFFADLFLHWENRKALLKLYMTGERRGNGLDLINTALPENVVPAWKLVESSLTALVEEDDENFAQHTRDFSDDFITNFGDGGSKASYIQFMGHHYRSGASEGITVNLEEMEFAIEEDKVLFNNIMVYFQFGALNYSYVLQKIEGVWEVTTIRVPDQQGGKV